MTTQRPSEKQLHLYACLLNEVAEREDAMRIYTMGGRYSRNALGMNIRHIAFAQTIRNHVTTKRCYTDDKEVYYAKLPHGAVIDTPRLMHWLPQGFDLETCTEIRHALRSMRSLEVQFRDLSLIRRNVSFKNHPRHRSPSA